MTNEITTMKVLKKDRAWMQLLFGQPTHVAFHKMRNLCPHPENLRIYTSALVKKDRTSFDASDELIDYETVIGFRCSACNLYVFAPRAEV
jgi:hypothetical protein